MRKLIPVIVILVLAGVGWGIYSLIVANQEIVADEASPLAAAPAPVNAASPPEPSPTPPAAQPASVIDDMLDKMDAATKEQFREATAAVQGKVMVTDDPMPAPAAVPSPQPVAPAPPALPPPSEPSSPQLLARGAFEARAHEVEGRALLIDVGSAKTIRFEDFETINGPNLHIYLAADLGAKDFVDLGRIKATKGNVNYEVPAGTDTTRYNKVLVWCVPFRVLFSYAELQ